MKRVMVLLAENHEEVEALMPVDLMRRAGLEVVLVSVTGQLEVTGSHNITVKTDALLENVTAEEADAVMLPGGMPGTLNLRDNALVEKLVTDMYGAGKIVSAICAAPIVLGKYGILEGRKATCYPGFEEQLNGGEFVDEMAVVDGNVITSRGLGTSMEFGFALIEQLVSKEAANEVRKQIVFQYER